MVQRYSLAWPLALLPTTSLTFKLRCWVESLQFELDNWRFWKSFYFYPGYSESCFAWCLHFKQTWLTPDIHYKHMETRNDWPDGRQMKKPVLDGILMQCGIMEVAFLCVCHIDIITIQIKITGLSHKLLCLLCAQWELGQRNPFWEPGCPPSWKIYVTAGDFYCTAHKVLWSHFYPLCHYNAATVWGLSGLKY